MSILKMSMMASILIIIITLIRMFAIHKLPKQIFVLLWSIVLCRLIIPFSIPINIFAKEQQIEPIGEGIFDSRHFEKMMIRNDNVVAHQFIYQDLSLANQSHGSISPYMLLWLLGSIFLATYFIVTHIRFVREYETSLPVWHPNINQWLSTCPLKRRIDVRESDKIVSPLTYGLFRPIILLPKGTDYNNIRHLNYVLTHELIHIKRLDVLYKWLLVLTLCIHWFNPIVWLFYRLANRDLELSCDEAVVKKYGESNKAEYALTLINLAEKGSKWAPFLSSFSKNSIEERIIAIMKPRRKNIIGVLLTMVLIFGTTLVTYADTNVASNQAGARSLQFYDQVVSAEDFKRFANPYGVSDKVYIDKNAEERLFIEGAVFTEQHVYALIGLAGNVNHALEMTGQFVERNHQSIYDLADNFKEINPQDDIRYFLYHGEFTDEEINFHDHIGGYLNLNLRIHDKDYQLKATVSHVAKESLLFVPETDEDHDIFYDTILLTPRGLHLIGQSDELTISKGKIEYPHYQITIVRNNDQLININYDNSGLNIDHDFEIEGGRGSNHEGEFYHTWHFKNIELDLTDITAVIINGVTYHVSND